MHRGSFDARSAPGLATSACTQTRVYLDFYVRLHDPLLTKYCVENVQTLNAEPSKCSDIKFVALTELSKFPMPDHTESAILNIFSQNQPMGDGEEEFFFSERDLKSM